MYKIEGKTVLYIRMYISWIKFVSAISNMCRLWIIKKRIIMLYDSTPYVSYFNYLMSKIITYMLKQIKVMTQAYFIKSLFCLELCCNNLQVYF